LGFDAVIAAPKSLEQISDCELAQRIGARDVAAMRLVMSRNNQRLFRVIWSILRHRPDCEDALQDTYLNAFAKISSFAGRASLSTWLTRIAINCALERKRENARREQELQQVQVASLAEFRERRFGQEAGPQSEEEKLMQAEISEVLKAAIARLPEEFRVVLVLRDIEGLAISEVADILQIPIATVKTRAFRARRLLRTELQTKFGAALAGALQFAGENCARMTQRVLHALALS
jgi:RNA polymerase sigma-70 factor, ECF subfamily